MRFSKAVVAVAMGRPVYYGLTVNPTRNERPRSGNPFTSEYFQSRAFSTRRRRSAGIQRASEAFTPRSSEARSGVSPERIFPSASTKTKGSSIEALHQKSASAVTPRKGPASTEPPARHSERLASLPPVTRFFPSKCAARPSTHTFDTGMIRAEYSSPSTRALPTLSATKKELDWMRSRNRVVYHVALALILPARHEPSAPASQVRER